MLEGLQQHIVQVLVSSPESTVGVLLVAFVYLSSMEVRDCPTEECCYHDACRKEAELLDA